MIEKTNIAEAIDRLKLSQSAYENQEKREQEDLEFQIPANQWTKASQAEREGSTVDGIEVGARPQLSISKLDQPIQLVVNQQRTADLGVKIHPISPDANVETARMLQELYRSIERDSRANIARGWAFERAVKAGRGFYRVNTVYADDANDPFDQKITIERILHQDNVYLDPSAQMPDWSDGEFAFCGRWVPIDRYQREYPKSALSAYGEGSLMDLQIEIPEWVTYGRGRPNAVLVAEYFRKTYTKETWVELEDGGYAILDNLPEGAVVREDGHRRTVETPTVVWSVINGIEEVSDVQTWNGKYIPIIPVIGRELQPFDSDRYFVGMIGPAKDGQRLYNYAATNAVEIGSLEPRAPWLMYEGQDEGNEKMWQQSNTRNFPYLKVKNVMIGGQPAPLPTRVPIDGSRLSVSMQLLQQADEYIQATTSTFDPSLGRGGSDRSGRAVMALQQQSDAGTSQYLDNLASVSMTYEAKVILDLIPAVYDRPGRVVQLINGEDDQSSALVNMPFFLDPETQRPTPLSPGGMPPSALSGIPPMGMPQGPPTGIPPMGAPLGMPTIGGGPPEGLALGGMGAMGMPVQRPPQTPKEQFHDLKKGVYGVAVTVGRSFQTRLDEGATAMGQILQGNPALLPLIGPLYFKYRDFPGSEEIAKLLKREREHMMPWQQDDDGVNTEALMSQIQQMGEQGQQLQAELQKATEFIKTDQAKWAAQAAIAKMKLGSEMEMQSMHDNTLIQIENIRSMTKGAITENKAVQEQISLNEKQRHATEMTHTHIRSGQEAQAAKAEDEQILEAMKVEGEVTRDAIRAKIDVEKDLATRESPEVSIDVELPGGLDTA